MIGYCAGQSVKVQQMVGVDQAGRNQVLIHLIPTSLVFAQLGPFGGYPGLALGVKLKALFAITCITFMP